MQNSKIDNKIALHGGTYSLTVTVIVLAILVAVNVLVNVLPETLTKLDISSSRLYSITSNTKVVVNSLEEDVTIYWIVQSGSEDSVLEHLLAKYDSLSGHIEVIKKNPDAYPTFTAQYTEEKVQNNSLIVVCGEKSRYISYSDIYQSDIDYTTYSQVYSFDGEGAITSAIDYVVSEELPRLYVLEGHGEAELPAEFADQIEKENMELQSFSLLNGEIPEEADCLLIYAPESDISEEEKELLAEYIAEGGKLLVFAGTTADGTLERLYSLLEEYGIEAADGFVVEEDRSYYTFRSPYILLPELKNDTITDALLEENYYVIMALAQGLNIEHAENGTVTELMRTSDTAFSKTDGYAFTTYEREEQDQDGPFSLAVSIETEGGGELIWVASSHFLEEVYNAYSSGANLDFAMNALSSLIGEREAIAIRTKALGYNYLTISDTASSMLQLILIGVLPLAFVVLGIGVLTERRRKRNEQG